MHKTTVSILGAGSWGTAVAIHLANAGHTVLLWAHNEQHVKSMLESKCNQRYLPNIEFPKTLLPTFSLDQCLNQSEHTIIAVPSHAFSSLLNKISKPPQGISWLTKGIDPDTHQLLSDLVAKKWGEKTYPVNIISGPSFAKEVAQHMPTALVIASNNSLYQSQIQELLHHNQLRAYISNDPVGVQLCGAVKNVLAIACGVSDGLNFGANAKAALITRGLAEMSRLGIRLGAQENTFMGLAGVGDLVLTCTDNQSRNRRFGLELGRGANPIDAEKSIGQVVEGKYNAAQVCTLAMQFQIEMPICMEINKLLSGQVTAIQAAHNLISRPLQK